MLKCAAFFLALWCSILSVPAYSEQIYAAYDGPNAIKVGGGGAKVEKNGVEYWTMGAPSRPFQVLGIFTDARKNRWWDGNAVGSASVAKKVKEVGGNAVVIFDRDTKTVGVNNFSQSNGSFSGDVNQYGSFSGSTSESTFGTSQIIQRTTTQLLVIRYLTETEIAAYQGTIPSLYPTASVNADAPVASTDASVRNPNASVAVSPPPKRPAKTTSGFCFDVGPGYVGTGSATKPVLTSATPACSQVTGE